MIFLYVLNIWIWLRHAVWLSVSVQFSSVQSLSPVWLFATPWTAARQASLSITNSRSSLRLTSIESVMPSSHLILCHPLLLLTPIPPSIRVFSNESTLRMRWPKYWRFSLNISPSNEHSGLISFGDRDQDHPHGKEMQKSKMAVWGGLTNSWEKKRSQKQRRKGKI